MIQRLRSAIARVLAVLATVLSLGRLDVTADGGAVVERRKAGPEAAMEGADDADEAPDQP